MQQKPDKKTLIMMRKAANNLPVVLRPAKTSVSGSALLKFDPDFTFPDGSKPLADYNYSFISDFPVNHYRKMKYLYSIGGIPAVEDYIKSVIDMSVNAVNGQNDLIGGMRNRANSINL